MPQKKEKRLEYIGLAIIFLSIPVLIFGVQYGLDKLRMDNKLSIQKNFSRDLSDQIDAYVFNKVTGITQALASIEEVLDQQLNSSEYDRHETLIALRTTKALFHASIVYVMGKNGTVIACTPYGENNKTLSGKNYAFRPYFKHAMEGKNVVNLALGATTGERGIYFSSPVISKKADAPMGVVVIKIGLEDIDKIINQPDHPTALLSPDGIIFSTNRPKWLFHAAFPISAERLLEIKESKQFAKEPLSPLPYMLNDDQVMISNAFHSIIRYPILADGWQIITAEPLDVNFNLKPIHVALVVIALSIISFLTILVIMLIFNIIRRKTAENQIIQLAEAFKRFVPEEFLKFLHKQSITDVELGDQVQHEMTILFTDIRGFTSISEKMTPKETFAFINEFLSEMEPVITEHDGVIDKYIGDAIMTLFPSSTQALKASIKMLDTLERYNRSRAEKQKPPVHIGIGLNFGIMTLGTIGGKSRMDSTVISDAVNLASRIEGLTKDYGVPLLLSEQTVARLEDQAQFSLRKIGKAKVKGKSEIIVVYEAFDADPLELKEKKHATMDLFDEAYSYFYSGDLEKAQSLFQECLEKNPEDNVVRVYMERCRNG
ncbi:adenylate/guanylate cyclase domain-containing protein [Thermodesulfobacteriota bacterium]